MISPYTTPNGASMKTGNLLLLLLLVPKVLFSQENSDCDSLYLHFENSFKKIGRIVYDEPPVLFQIKASYILPTLTPWIPGPFSRGLLLMPRANQCAQKSLKAIKNY